MKLTPPLYFLIFLIVSLIQSYFTELAHDEAYYWVYSQNLDWGHFDHPPGAGALIAMGYAIFKNELGVRLFIVIANVLSLWFIYKTVNPKKYHLFFLLFFSCLIANVGFMAVPDIPLLLCSSAFIYFFKQYLEEDNWKTAIILGVIIAAMGYSKYHGIVILAAALLANRHLLKRKSFWGLLLVGILLFFPHLYWQYVNDFPTFRFHLFDRSSEPYSYLFILEYIGGQLAIFGPFIGFLLFWGAYKLETKTPFERTMKWCFYGIFGFFLLSSLKGRVEPNWTVAGIIPLLYLGYHFIEQKEKLTQWAYRLAIPSIILITIARFVIGIDSIPIKGVELPKEFHGWQAWADDLEAAVGETPVIFYNNYQRAAKYSFYSGNEAFALNTSNYAGSQYDLLIEQQENLQGKKVALVSGANENEEGIQLGNIEKSKYRIVEDFKCYQRVRIKMLDSPKSMSPNEKKKVRISFYNPTNKIVVFEPNKGKEMQLFCFVYEYKKHISRNLAIEKFPIKQLAPKESKELEVELIAPEKAGDYRYRFSIHSGIIGERNCNFQKLRVE